VGNVVNFHLPADDVERAAKFYHEVFGWRFPRFPDSPVPYLLADATEQNGSGIPAAITQRQEVVKAPVPTIEVERIDEAMTDIAMKGGQQGRVQDIAGVGRFGYAIDCEGNVIAVVERTRVTT
jgi:uncharacterized protein